MEALQHGFGIQVRPGHRQTSRGNERPLTGLVLGAPKPHGQGKFSSCHHANSHGFAVQVGAIAAEGLHHMAEGMAVVEDCPQAPLPFVGRHHQGLGLGGVLQNLLQQAGAQGMAAGQPPGWICLGSGLQAREQRSIADCTRTDPPIANHPVLDHFGHAGTEFPIRERGQGEWIDQDQLRLVEGTNQVFAPRMVDTGFATNGGIDHGEKGGWNLHHGNAPQPTGGGKTGHVAHHAAAKGHDQRPSLQFVLERRVVDQRHSGGVFLLLAGFDHQQLADKARRVQAG